MNGKPVYTLEAALAAAAEAAGVSVPQIIAHEQTKGVVLVRYVAVLLMRRYCPDATLKAIGAALDRDHTTMLYSLKQAATLDERDPVCRALYDRAAALLEESGP